MILSIPTLASSPLEFAEWLELRALVLAPRAAGEADLRSVLCGVEDDPAVLENPDDDSDLDETIQSVYAELGLRSAWAGRGYPFRFDHGNLKFMQTPIRDGDLGYAFNLLVSLWRGLSKDEREEFPGADGVPSLFQRCATVAAAGLIEGDAACFGHPRHEHQPFYDYLGELATRMNDGRPHAQWLEGRPVTPKDGGVDILAWRDVGDALPGKISLYGNCASGSNWTGKKPVEEAESFRDLFWSSRPCSPLVVATFVPFDIRSEIVQGPYESLDEAWKWERWRETLNSGIVVDRFRFARAFARGCALSRREIVQIDAGTIIAEIRQWLQPASDAVRADLG